jgi:hypothetical protein
MAAEGVRLPRHYSAIAGALRWRRRPEASADGGNDIGWIAAGEWLNYSVNAHELR